VGGQTALVSVATKVGDGRVKEALRLPLDDDVARTRQLVVAVGQFLPISAS
jgi:hypothetical protein